MIHGQQLCVDFTVLNGSAILAFVLMLYLLRLVLDYNIIIFVKINLGTFSRLLDFFSTPSFLNAYMFVHLRFKDAELILLGS